jgi:hypothetical protein
MVNRTRPAHLDACTFLQTERTTLLLQPASQPLAFIAPGYLGTDTGRVVTERISVTWRYRHSHSTCIYFLFFLAGIPLLTFCARSCIIALRGTHILVAFWPAPRSAAKRTGTWQPGKEFRVCLIPGAAFGMIPWTRTICFPFTFVTGWPKPLKEGAYYTGLYMILLRYGKIELASAVGR